MTSEPNAIQRYETWKETRWQYEVLCRILDAEIDLWQKGKRAVPMDVMTRLETVRVQLNKDCDALAAALSRCQ